MAKYVEYIQNVNTFLTNFVQGYRQRTVSTADFVAPPFQVKLEAGKYAEYNKSVFRVWDDKIIGDEEPKQIQWDVDENTYACEEYSMGKFVSNKKKAQAIDPIRLDLDAVQMLARFHAKAREYRVNAIAGSEAIVTNHTHVASAWATPASAVPVQQILNAMADIVDKLPLEEFNPGDSRFRMLIPIKVGLTMIQSDDWKEYFVNHAQVDKALFSAVDGLRQMGIEPLMLSPQGLSEPKGSASDPKTESIWDDNVLLFFCEPNPTTESQTFMYSPYVAQNVVTTTPAQRRRGVYHDIYSDIDELLVNSDAAHLLLNTL